MRGQSHVVAEFPIEHREHVLDLRRVGVADGVRDGELVGAGREELLREAQDGGRIDLAFDGAAEGCREPGEQADAATRLARFFVSTEERRVGDGGVRTCRSVGSPYYEKKKIKR